MSEPGQYKDFNKTANDLLTKFFPKKVGQNSWGVELELKPTEYAKFGTKISNVGGDSTGEMSSEINFSEFGITLKTLFKTDKPTLELSWKVSDKLTVPGLSAKVHLDATDKSQTTGVSVAYEHQYFNLNARVYVPISVQILDFAKDIANQDTKLDVDIVVAHPDTKFALAAASKVSFPQNGERKFEESSVSLAYREGKSFNPSLTYTQKSGEKDKEESRTVSAIVTVKPGETQYVGQLDYDIGTKTSVVTVGLSYPTNDDAVVKAKINTKKEIGLSYSKSLSSSTKLDFGTLLLVNTEKNLTIDSAVSLSLKFTQ